MTDWKGNEIKAGMEICAMRIADSKFGGYFPIPDEIEYYKVNEDGSVTNGEFTHTFELFKKLCYSTNTHVLAIKGISDNKEEYDNYRKN